MSALPFPTPARGRFAAGVLLQLALSVWIALGFASCSHPDNASPQERALAGAILNSRRAASLRGWEHKSMHGEPALAYSLQRTAIVLPPGVRMEQRTERVGDAVMVEAKFTGSNNGLFTASAAAVADDGYYLTAAHCLDEGSCTLVALTRDGKIKMAPARVVWCGLKERGGPDVGLVHASVAPAGTIPLAVSRAEQEGSLIFTSGFGARGPGGSGGHVVHSGNLQQRPSGVRWREIFHDAPLAPGDSGGPLIDEKGRLLGINTQIRGQWKHYNKAIALTNYTGVAVCPEAGWIQALIANDRAVRRAGGGVSPTAVHRH